jgi:hypothetical protein
MAKRLKNLKRKKFKINEYKLKCNYCRFYIEEYDYNECTLKEWLTCFYIEKQRFCKKFEDFALLQNINTRPYYIDDNELPF